MANGNGTKLRHDPDTRFYVAVAIGVATVLGGNGILVRQATVDVGQDRFFGYEGRAVERRVAALEEDNKRLELHLANHPDHALRLSLREALLRIEHLETENAQLRDELREIRQNSQ